MAAALSSLKAAKDIAESMVGLRDAAAFQGKLIEFQTKLIDANNATFAAQDERAVMLERIRQLEKEMADLKTWETKEQEYELQNLGFGAFAYMLKPEARGTKPAHWVCTNCYEHRHIAIMQNVMKKGIGQEWTCPSCKSTFLPSINNPVWKD